MKARDNPFRSERLHALRYRSPEGAECDDALARIAALDYRAAIVGPQGSGKTTLQNEIAQALAQSGVAVRWLRLRRDDRRESRRRVRALLAELRPDELIFVDGAEQLRWFAWRRLLRRSAGCRGVVITTHAPGRLPTAVECRTTPELLRRLVAELAPAAGGPALDDLFARHGGNLRLCFRELYDRWGKLHSSCQSSPASGRAGNSVQVCRL